MRPASMSVDRRSFFVAGAGLLALPRVARARADDSWGRIRAARQIVLGIEVEETGLCVRTASGQLDGYLIALGQGLAQGLGVRPVFVETVAGRRVADLRASRCDVLLSSPPLGPGALRLAMFTSPYASLEWRVLVPEEAARTGLAGVREMRLSVPAGLTRSWIAEQLAWTGAELVPVERWQDAVTAYQARRIDGAVMTDLMALRFVEVVPELAAGPSLANSLMGAGVRWGEHDLLQAIEMQLDLLRQRGILDILARHYSGRAAPVDAHE